MQSRRLQFLRKLGAHQMQLCTVVASGTERPRELRARAGVDAQDPGSGSRGQVERTGVIGDHQIGFEAECRELRKSSLATEVEHSQRG